MSPLRSHLGRGPARWQRALLLGVPPVTGIVVLRGIPNAFTAPKMVVLQLGAVGLVGLVALTVLRHPEEAHRWAPRRHPADLATLALAGALLLATVLSTSPRTSLWGFYPRSTGLTFHLSLLVYWWAATRLLRREHLEVVARLLLFGSIPVLLYGTVQGLGLDPLVWRSSQFSGAFSTLGNPNFLAGYTAILTPLLLGLALHTRGGWRWAAALTLALSLPVIVFTGAAQGPVAMAAGLFTWVVIHLASRRRMAEGRARQRLTLLLIGISAVAVVTVPIAAWVGSAQLDQGLRERRLLYTTALDLVGRSPVVGQGLDTFGEQFLPNRPIAHARIAGEATADAVHSVPLSMLYGGGAVLSLAYAAFVVVTGVMLVRVIRRGGAALPLVAGVGGAWAAYHVQSLVSIEMPALAVLHHLFAGVIVAMARQDHADVPTAPPSSRRRGRAARARTLAPRHIVLAVGLIMVLLAGSWLVTRPLRAELAVGRAATAAGSGDLPAAVGAFERSHRLAPEIGEYYVAHASVLEQAGEPEAALAVLERAVAVSTSSGAPSSAAAVLAERLGERQRADELHRAALEIDPLNPLLLRRAAASHQQAARLEEATALLERALEVEPGNARAWAELGDVRAEAGDDRAARVAYEVALELRPDLPSAARGLAGLADG